MNKQIKSKFFRIVGLAAILTMQSAFGAGQSGPATSDVSIEDLYRINANMPGGKFTVNTVDMRIKIANGYFTWSRTYDGNGWRFSPHLAGLGFVSRMVLGLEGSSGGGGGGGSGGTVTPTPPQSVSESFGFVGAYAAYERDFVSPDVVVRNGTEFEHDDMHHFFQQKGGSGRFFVERASIQGREGLFYRWQDRMGDWIIYDAYGWIDSYGNANGLTASVEYDSLPVLDGKKGRKLKAIKDRNGNTVLTFVYDQVHPTVLREVREVLLPGESFTPRVVKYDYDFSSGPGGNGLLTKITDAAGNPMSFGYDETYRLTSITDGEGRTRRLEYSGKSSRKVKEIAADGTETTFAYAYDKTKKQYSVRKSLPATAAGRRVVEDIYDADGVQIRQEINGQFSGAFSEDGRESTTLNSVGRQTRTTRNEFDLVTRIDYPDSASASMEYSPSNLKMTKHTDAAGMVSTYQYDEKGNLIKYVQAVGTPVERVATYVNDGDGLPLSVTLHGRTEPNGVVTPDAVRRFEYDVRGNLRTAIDAEGLSRRYLVTPDETVAEYVDARNNKTVFDLDGKGRPLAVRAPLGQTYSYSYDKGGKLVAQTDPLGRTIRLAYDAKNRLVQASDAKNGVVKYEYDSTGERTRKTDADGRAVSFEYDNLKRLIKTVDGIGNTTEYRYELPGQSELSAGTSQGINRLPTEIRFPTFVQSLERDAAERVVRTTTTYDSSSGAKQVATSQEYDRRSLVTRVIEQGREVGLAYDALAQPVETTDQANKVTRLIRNIRGNPIELADSDGRLTRFEYDRNDRRVKEILPLGQVKTYEYDEVGNVKAVVDRNGNRSEFSYDALNRITQAISTQKDGTKASTTSFAWNLDDSLASYTDTDHVRNLVNGAAFTYDELGRRIGTTVTYPSGYQLSYGYDYSAAGFKTRLTWPDGTPITYSYTSHGVLESVAIPGEGNIQYSVFKGNRSAEVVFPGGLRQQRRYDGLSNLEGVKVTAGQQPPALDLTYDYNSRQELVSSNRTDNVDGQISTKARTFEFDEVDRLTQVKTDSGGLFGKTNQVFSYDNLGNRISDSATVGSWTYDANSRLRQKGSGRDEIRFEYDDAGNLVNKLGPDGASTTYSYDSHNRLIAVNGPNGELIARYGYDPQDRRIWREQFRAKDLSRLPKAKRTLYLYADEGLIAEAEQEIALDNDGVVTAGEHPVITTQYGPQPNSMFTTGVLFVKAKGSDGKDAFAYFQLDRLGAPIQAFNKLGVLVWSADYDVYGKATITTPLASAERATIANSLRLPGQIEDPETGLHYNWRRYYDPGLGRYITSDPIGLGGGLNRYAYGSANPSRWVDPKGEFAFLYPVVIVAATFVTAVIIDRWWNSVVNNHRDPQGGFPPDMVPPQCPPAGGGWGSWPFRSEQADSPAGDGAKTGAGGDAPAANSGEDGARNGNDGTKDGTNKPTNNAKPPKDPQTITNPPQAPPIPEDWTIAPNPRRPGGIIATPPGVEPGSSDKGSEHIRVDPPGSSPVPGLEDGYWRWNRPGVGAYNPDKNNFGGTQGQTHVPLPPGYPIPQP